MKNVLIADDEPHARAYLERLLSQRDDVHLVASLKNGQEVIDFCRTFSPDLVLLDIEMPGKTGLEAAKAVSKYHPNAIVLFTTAFDQYAIEAFEYAAIGYILKPFDEEELYKNIDRALSTWEVKQKANLNDRLHRLWDKMQERDRKYLSSFQLKSRGLEFEIEAEAVLYLASDSEYTQIHTLEKTHLKRQSLKNLESQLPQEFHRIHRSIILNSSHVISWKYQSNGTFAFEMKDGEVLTSSRSYKANIKEWVSQ